MNRRETMTRRDFLKKAAVASGGLLLAACTPEMVKETVVVEKPVKETVLVKETVIVEKQAPVEVTAWVNHEELLELADRFNQSQGEYIVKAEQQGSYAEISTKVQAALAAGYVPAVPQFSRVYATAYIVAGALQPLDPFEQAEADWSWDQFIPAMLARGLWEGKNYAMPLARSTPLAYYNKEVFAEAGLPDRTPATWDEFREFCITLSDPPEKYGYAFSNSKSSTQWYFQATVYSQGAHISDEQCNVLVDSPETIAAVQRMADMVHKDQCAVLKGSETDLWYNRNVGMIWSSIGSLQSRLNNADFEVGVGGLAQEPGGKVPLGGSSLWIMTDVPDDEAQGAWEWLKFIAREDNQIWWLQQTGYAPFTYKAVEDLAGYFAENPLYKTAVDYATQNAKRQECITIAPRSTQIFYDTMQEILIAGTPVAEVLKRAADALRADYEETYG